MLLYLLPLIFVLVWAILMTAIFRLSSPRYIWNPILSLPVVILATLFYFVCAVLWINPIISTILVLYGVVIVGTGINEIVDYVRYRKRRSRRP